LRLARRRGLLLRLLELLLDLLHVLRLEARSHFTEGAPGFCWSQGPAVEVDADDAHGGIVHRRSPGGPLCFAQRLAALAWRPASAALDRTGCRPESGGRVVASSRCALRVQVGLRVVVSDGTRLALTCSTALPAPSARLRTAAPAPGRPPATCRASDKIGRASCRERV